MQKIKDLMEDHKKWHIETPFWRTKLLRTLIIDVLIGLSMLLCVEMGLRHFTPSMRSLLFTAELTGGNPVTKNKYGLRDVEFPIEKPSRETRILALGNSTTYGSGVAQEMTWPKQLQHLLNNNQTDKSYFVINAGGQGNSPFEALDFLKEKGVYYDPSLIIFAFSPSMIAKTAEFSRKHSRSSHTKDISPSFTARMKSQTREAMMIMHKFLHGSLTYAAFDYYVRKNLYYFGIIQDDLNKPSGVVYAYAFDVKGVELDKVNTAYDNFYALLKEIKTVSDTNGIPLIIVNIPSQFEISNLPSDNPRRFPKDKIRIYPGDKIMKYAEELYIPALDMREVLKERRIVMDTGKIPWNPLYIPADYSHLNDDGLFLISHRIQEFIEKQKN